MNAYSYNDECPVCTRDIKRRPADFAGRPCVNCMAQWVTPRDRYRLRHARLTPATIQDIIDHARNRYNERNG